MTIRVVSIISRMNVGGPAVLLTDLIDRFAQEEIEHTLIAGRCLPNEIDYLDTHHLHSEVIYIDSLKRTILPLGDLRTFFKLVRLLRQLNPDIVHTHTSKAGALGRTAAKIANPRAKIIHTYHGHLLYGYFSASKKMLMVLLEKILAHFTDQLIAVSRQVKEDLLAVGIGQEGNWIVLRPGLPAKKPTSKSQSRIDLNIRQDLFVIAWVGRFTEVKNPNLAVEVLVELLNKVSKPIQMIMAGEGELWNEIKEMAAEHKAPIKFLGWTDSVDTLLSASDILLMTSRNEGMPVVVIEAAIQSTPTVSTNVGGIGDFIESGENGLLASEDSKSLANAVLELFGNERELDLLGKSAHDLALRDFSIEKSVKNHVELYRSIIGVQRKGN